MSVEVAAIYILRFDCPSASAGTRKMQILEYVAATALFLATHTLAEKEDNGPTTIPELLELAFPNGDAPNFVPLQGVENVAIANNDTSILQASKLTISPYPLKPGHVTFTLNHNLTAGFPQHSTMELKSYVGNELAYEGSVDICKFMRFARLNCPLMPYTRPQIMKQVLQVPDDVPNSRISFVLKALTPTQELIAQVAAIVDITNERWSAHEEL